MKNLKGIYRESPAYKMWLAFNTLGLFIIFAASTLAPAFPFYWNSFIKYIYNVLAFALIVLYIIFGREEKRAEVRLCAAFCIWVLISRFLNGDFMLSDGKFVLDIAVSCMFFPMCMLLDEKKRSILLDVLSFLICLFFTFSALMGIYTAISQKLIINPFSEWFFAEIRNHRLWIYAHNANIASCWMMVSLALLVYQFAKRKNLLLRIALLLMMAVNFAGATLTDSRNIMLGISAGAGALVLLLALKYLPLKKQSLKAMLAAVLVIIVMPLTYKSFSLLRGAIQTASESYVLSHTEADGAGQENGAENDISGLPEDTGDLAEDSPAGTPAEESTDEQDEEQFDTIAEDKRGFGDSGRIPIYKSAIYSLKIEPMRLLRGSLSADTMAITDEYLPNPPYAHYHNSLLQVLEFAGLPGLLLELAFLILLVIRAVRLFFTQDSRASMAVKTLIILLPGFYIYNMLESSIFYTVDFRSIAFFLIAGAVTAYSYEICPVKKKKT